MSIKTLRNIIREEFSRLAEMSIPMLDRRVITYLEQKADEMGIIEMGDDTTYWSSGIPINRICADLGISEADIESIEDALDAKGYVTVYNDRDPDIDDADRMMITKV